VLVGAAPVTLLVFAGAFNGLILPIGFTVVLWVAWRRRDLLGGYRYPAWLLGAACWPGCPHSSWGTGRSAGWPPCESRRCEGATMRIDLNSDLGESFGRWTLGDDDAMLGLVTSANVACGFHAGDATTLRRTCARATRGGVAVGAQVSYRDLAGFGRRFVDMDPGELADDVVYQLGALEGMCRVAGTSVRYVKPHGALYNAVVHHAGQARAVVAAVRDYDAALPVLGLPGSELLRAAEEAGLRAVSEFFVDRGYTPEGTLVPRSEPGALLHDPDAVTTRALRMVIDGVVAAVDGSDVRVTAESVCVHGDSPGAVAMAQAVRHGLGSAGVELRAF
jgi:UPF0271 protein